MSTKLPPRMRHKFKLRNNRLQQSSVELDQQIELMTNNLLKVQRELTEEEEHEPYSDLDMMNAQRQKLDKFMSQGNQQEAMVDQQLHEGQQLARQQEQSHIKLYSQEQSPQLVTQSMKQQLKHKYQEYLTKNKFSSNYEQKINQLLDSDQQHMSIGNTIALFEMVYYFKEILTTQVLGQIQTKAFDVFVKLVQKEGEQRTPENQEKTYQQHNNNNLGPSTTGNQGNLLKTCLTQIISICGIYNQQTIQFFTQYMLQHPLQFTLSYKLLINLGYPSILTLIKILNEDLQQFTPNLLHYLANTQFIIQKIFLPNIMNDLTNSTISSKEKNIALTVLSRLGELVNSQRLTQTLVGLFKSNTIDKKLLISAIKMTGRQQGQRILINLLHQPNLTEDIAIFIIKCLSQSQNNVKTLPQILVQEYPTNNLFQMNKLYFYELTISKEQQTPKDIIYINPRIFCSSLEKLALNIQHSLQNTDEFSIKQLQCPQMFVLPSVVGCDQQQILPNLQIINLLMSFIDKSYKKNKIKQAAIEAIGCLTLPQNPSDIIQKLTICLNTNTDPAIISSTCLTLSKIPFKPSNKLVNKLSQLLRNNYWKVRISACQTIGNLLRQPIESVIQTLIKCLKDGSINRQLVCQTMIRIHTVCQKLLIEILKDSKDSKIQEIILCSFNQPQILYSQNLPTILETVFEFSNNKRKQLRYISIGVVNSLRKHAQQSEKEISYFKAKNILPFYYGFLDDSCAEIRDLALGLILEFGSYAELVLIEGMTKGRVNCKIQCAKGLGLRGIQNFRALLLGMRDLNDKVRLQCCEAILNNFQIAQIVNEYKDKSSQCISLIYNIKDLLNVNTLNHPSIKHFLSQLIQRLCYQANVQLQADQSDTEEQQIQKQINQFRQSMKMRKDQLESEKEQQPSINNENDQNRDPNIGVQQDNIKNYKNLKISTTKTNQPFAETNTEQGKRYYFKLNESIA